MRTPKSGKSSRRRRPLWWGLVALLLAGVGTVLTVEVLRWRAQFVALKAVGLIPGISWTETATLIRPGSGISLREMIHTRNPYHSIQNPRQSDGDVAAGREIFASSCAACHGLEANGATAPSLVAGSPSQGASDWALYQTIHRGVPEAGMAPSGLPREQIWQVIAYLQSLRSRYSVEGLRPEPAALPPVRPVPASALERAREAPGDWLTYSGAYDGWRHSSLDQINRANVAGLRLLWMYQHEEKWPNFETSPIAVDGVLFVTTPANSVLAIDAESGVVRWSRDRITGEPLSLCCGWVNRGLAILDSTLFLATLDARMVALDARTGVVRWDVPVADPGKGFSFTSAPLAVGDMVVIGSAGGEFAARGFITALDAATGAVRWRFETIPGEGEPGNETWSGDSWKSGGGPSWLTGSYDPALGLLYLGIGNPNPDFNGEARLGDNLYTNSVVALDAATGALRWHFQFTPHDEHDWDSLQIPVLVNAPDSTGRPLMLWANRNGFYYVLDRATGEFLRGRAFVKQTWADGLDAAGRPLTRPESSPTREGVLVYPGGSGATNWWSPSYHPQTGLFYVPAFRRGDVFFKGKDAREVNTARVGGGLRPARERTGRMSVRALDAMTGEQRWEHVITDTLTAHREHVGGLLSTAGNIVFGGADDLLVVLDAVDGRRLWSFRGGSVHAAPITYLVNGRQRITIAAGRALLTFGLDQAAPR
jgi:alcohol dehydrogenase (cytochrome c)